MSASLTLFSYTRILFFSLQTVQALMYGISSWSALLVKVSVNGFPLYIRISQNFF